MKNFRGVGVALVTPFAADGSVDYKALTRLVTHVMDGGVDYLVALGTTAETPTLSAYEREDIVQCIIELNKGRLPLVVGCGGNNTAEVVDSMRVMSEMKGVDVILSVTPYYNKPSQEGMYQHYMAVAEASSVPIMLYNVPGRTGVNMSAETTLRLAECENIMGIKEASGNLSQIGYILRDRPEGFLVISGDDNQTLPITALGGDGVISVSANAFTRVFCEMTHAALNEDFRHARELNFRLTEATDELFADGNPAGIKAALTIKGIMDNNLRLPLVKANDKVCAKLGELITKYDI